MSSIGGNDVMILRGKIPAFGETLQEITRKNVDGVAYRKGGKRSATTTLSTVVDIDTIANAAALKLTYKALQGTLVTIVDDFALETTSVAVLNVDVSVFEPVVGMVGGICEDGSNYLVRAIWTVQATTIVEE